jgi:hypothetical protein
MRNDLLALAVVKVIQSVVTAPSLTEHGSAQVDAVPFTICELVTPAFSKVFPLVSLTIFANCVLCVVTELCYVRHFESSARRKYPVRTRASDGPVS